ncbi:MAG: hypothetical protein IPM77_10280 [Crocinitomicaceae bacterium]|nr:hypothetical protein [Crocinitomicaceae bacterium]
MYLYTICSYSNLNQAIVLYDSIKQKTNGIFSFFCFLIDEIPDDFKLEDKSFKLVQVAELQKSLPEFDQLKLKYNAFELCCALKPFCGEYLFHQLKEEEVLVYLDSDILFYNDILLIAEELGAHDILLTPHFMSEPPDFNKISELDVNNTGLYNGGFFAFKNNSNTTEIMKWWKERMKQFCFTDFEKGMFVDQIWLNFVPLYFKNVLISRHKGLNVAYWNFHERNLSMNSYSAWKVNNESPLVFIHYSGFRLYRRDLISIHQTRYSFKEVPEIKELFQNYALLLEKNAAVFNLQIPSRTTKQRIQSKLKSILRNPFSKR